VSDHSICAWCGQQQQVPPVPIHCPVTFFLSWMTWAGSVRTFAFKCYWKI
jgi:hypothetical protein